MNRTFQEYPKCLVRDEDYVIVHDAQQEQAKRAEGWAMAGEEPKKRTRKVKQ